MQFKWDWTVRCTVYRLNIFLRNCTHKTYIPIIKIFSKCLKWNFTSDFYTNCYGPAIKNVQRQRKSTKY